MSKILQSLEQNLKNQLSLYEELTELEEKKQKALLVNNLPEIERITAREEQLVFLASRLERERYMWSEYIGQELGLTPETLTLSELILHYPSLNEVGQSLDAALGRLQNLHEQNTKLLKQAMSILNFTVGLLTQEEKTTYSHPERKSSPGYKQVHLLDRII